MRRSAVLLASLAACAAVPAAAADVSESYGRAERYERPRAETRAAVEAPYWRRITIEEEPVVEERIIVRRAPTVEVRRTYVEEYVGPRPRAVERVYVREGWRDGWTLRPHGPRIIARDPLW